MLSTCRYLTPSPRFPSIPSLNYHHHKVSFSTSLFAVSQKRHFSATSFQRQRARPPQLKENIYTIPNVLTLSRISASPILGWSILEGNYHLASGLLVYAGLTDLVCPFLLFQKALFLFSHFIQLDGFLARRFKMSSVLGTILDPAADKILMTTLTVTLAMQQLIPGKVEKSSPSSFTQELISFQCLWQS